MPCVRLLSVVFLCLPLTASKVAELRAVEGKAVTLECKPVLDASDLSSVVRVVWSRGSNVLASFSKTNQQSEWWVSDRRVDFSRADYTITIDKATKEDSYVYKCRAEFLDPDSHRSATLVRLYHIRMAVIGIPTTPGKVTVTSFTSRTVTLSWKASVTNTEAPIIQYLIVVSAGPKPSANNNKIVYSPGNGTTAIVTSLKPYTQYTFQAIAENLAGRSEVGPASQAFRTKGEAPVASPRITNIYNASNSSLVVTWEPPPIKTLHGPLRGYRVMTYKLMDGERKEHHVNSEHINSFALPGLAVYTKYMVSVEADNGFGYSPQDSKVVLTAEGVPNSGPIISNWVVLSSSSVSLVWSAPREANGLVRYYTIYYQSSRLRKRAVPTDSVRVTAGHNKEIAYELHNLEPYRKYLFWITASTARGEGPKSETNPIYTDTAAPSAPTMKNITIRAIDDIIVDWVLPKTVYRRIDMYTVRVRLNGNLNDEGNLHINTSTNSVSLRPLMDRRYLVSVKAMTQSIIKPDIQYIGPFSSEVAFMLRKQQPQSPKAEPQIYLYISTCDKYVDYNVGKFVIVCDPALLVGRPARYMPAEARSSVAAGILAVIGCFLLVAVLCACALLIYRRFSDGAKQMPDEFIPATLPRPELYDESDYPSIAVGVFGQHVERLQRDGGAGFSAEYETLDDRSTTVESHQELTSEHSVLAVNKDKNRYINILAYDHSRVVLRTNGAAEGNDYINANFIDGYRRRHCYIATQGPLPHTFGDFWRMIWEQKSLVIVMITNVIEKGRKKCDQYWPSEGSETYGGQFQVKLLNQSFTAYYAVRVFSLKNLKTLPRPTERVVFHYHYTHWPDHGVPCSCLPVLSFVRKSSAANSESAGPMVVHCSAGVGRSGTYMVIDSMLKQMQHRSTVNVFAFLRHIRQQRSFLVQTEQQYIFCHEALLEAIRAGLTEVSSAQFGNYIETMMPEQMDGKTLLQLQYELISSSPALESQIAHLFFNETKNRNDNFVSSDEFRVPLAAIAGQEGSDYINATFLQGFHKLDEFIVTQCPLETTTAEFWRMVWERNCQTVVLLCDFENSSYTQFWPSELQETWIYDTFSLQSISPSQCPTSHSYQSLSFILQSAQDDFQLSTRLIHCPEWPLPISNVWHLVDIVQRGEGETGPVVVMDNNGGPNAALFCALSCLACQLEMDGAVDCYYIAKLYEQRRMGVFGSYEDYHLLYECVRHLLKDTNSNSPSPPLPSPIPSVPASLSALLESNGVKTVAIPPAGSFRSALARDITL